jgi:hypothetical protein
VRTRNDSRTPKHIQTTLILWRLPHSHPQHLSLSSLSLASEDTQEDAADADAPSTAASTPYASSSASRSPDVSLPAPPAAPAAAAAPASATAAAAAVKAQGGSSSETEGRRQGHTAGNGDDEDDPLLPAWREAALKELESDLDIIRKFQSKAAALQQANERKSQLLWSAERKRRFREERAAAREKHERVHFARDGGAGGATDGPDGGGATFSNDVRENLGDLDGIGTYLESLHSAERKYPYRIPEGW